MRGRIRVIVVDVSPMFSAVKFSSFLAVMALGILPCVHPAFAISNGQIDSFEDGTSDGWGFGQGDWPVVAGGPGGINDHYLQVTADGNGAAGKLVAYNSSQWTGNYTSAGVNAIEMDLKAISITAGATKLTVRLAFRTQTGPLSSGGVAGYVTSTAMQLSVDGLWHHAVFQLASLVPVNSSGGAPPPPLSTFLTGPAEIRIINSATGGVVTGDAIVAVLGIDNIHAMQNVSIASTTRIAGGTIRLQGQGLPNVVYTIQATANLTQTFGSIGSVTSAADGTFQFDDTNASSFTQRFYRVKTP